MCYYIINKTTNITTKVTGSFPDVDELLDKGHKILIVSLYSNTIKVPYWEHGVWEWEDYRLPAGCLP